MEFYIFELVYNISHKLLKLNSWKKFRKFWNGPLCRNKSSPSPLLNVAVYWQSSYVKACAKKLSQILANSIGNMGRVIGLRIYVRYLGTKFQPKLTILSFWTKFSPKRYFQSKTRRPRTTSICF